MLDPRPRRDEPETSDHDVELARARIRELFAAALEAVEPARAVRDTLDWRDGCLVVGDATLPDAGGVHVVAVGKAAVAMTQGALEVRRRAIVSGDVITKEGHARSALPPNDCGCTKPDIPFRTSEA